MRERREGNRGHAFAFLFSVLSFFPRLLEAESQAQCTACIASVALFFLFFFSLHPGPFSFYRHRKGNGVLDGVRLRFFPVNESIRLSIFLCSSQSTMTMKKLFI